MVGVFSTVSRFKIEKSHFSNISIILVVQKQEAAPSTPTKDDERADGHVVTPKKAKLDFDFWGKTPRMKEVLQLLQQS
jgi:hypothetical protein